MKKVVRILLAILMVATLALGISACKSDCDKGNHDKYVKNETDATCTAAKVEHWACKNCDWTEDLTVGEKLGHDFTDWAPSETNADKHERTCKREGCDYKETADHEANAEGTACKDCNKPMGVPVCNHPDKTKTETPATCTTAKIEHWSCPDCTWTEDKTVGEPLNHDFEGQLWKVGGDKHYQECKRDGCNGRNEHNAAMTAFATVDGQHEHHCTVEGCAVFESHAPAFGDWVIADADNHYKVCSHCDLRSETGAHNHGKLNKIDDDQHSVACSVCGKIFENENHAWVKNEQKSESATCLKEGRNSYDCACGAEKSEPVEKLAHTRKFVITETTHKTVCEVCGETIIAEAAHEIVWNNTDKDEHWQYCKTCDYEVPNSRASHSYKDGELVCEVCNRTPEDVVVATFYKGEYHRFDTLVEAVASITDSENAVIYLGRDLEGAGIFIPSNRNINIRLQGNTYTVVSGAVGSVKYESQAFHIEKDSNITIQNGTITSKSGSGVKMLVQNYANLTLMNNLTLDGSNLDADGDNPLYTLSNNFGETLIRNTTIKVKTENDVALDVWYGMSAAYYDGVKVTLGVNNTIEGIIEYGSAVANTDWSKVALVMRTNRNHSIRFSGNVPSCEDANITFEDTGAKVLEHMLADSWSYADGHHFHACSRCSAHVDETECTRETVVGRDATCTLKGITDGVKCSVCNSVIVEQQEIDALGHDFNTDFVSVSSTQHAHKCSRCDAYDTAVDHTYVKNHCEVCGKTLTEEELLALIEDFASGSLHGQYLLSSGNGKNAEHTFMITGIYTGKSGDNGVLTFAGNKTIIAYKLDVTELVIGDEVTIWGAIKNYNSTIEFELSKTYNNNLEFGQELVNRGQSSITVEIVDTEGTASDRAAVTFIPELADGKAENMSTVKFTVNGLPEGWLVSNVSGVEYDYDSATKIYSFVVKGDVTITVEVKLDNGERTYEKTVTIETKSPNSAKSDKFTNGIVTIEFSGSTNDGRFNAEHYRMYSGAKAVIKSPEGCKITKVIFVTTTDKTANYSGSHILINNTKLQQNDVSGEYQYPWVSEQGVTEINIANDAQVRIIKIYVTYSYTVVCKHEHAQTISAATEATCENMGFKAAGIYCHDCGHFTTDGWNSLADENIVAAKGHDYELVEAVAGDCQNKSVAAHYTCKNNCGELFVDVEGVKTKTTLEQLQGEVGEHKYGAWAHVEGTATHSRTCSICNDIATEACKAAEGAEWQADDIDHWKVCAVCADGKVDLGNHNSDTHCTICDKDIVSFGSIIYKVYNEELEQIDNAVVSVDLPEKAAIGTSLTFTISSDAYNISLVEWSADVNAEVTTGETLDEYTFTVAATNVIIITVEAKATHTVSYINPENGTIEITRKDGEDIKWTHSDTNPSEATLYKGTELVINVSGEGTVTIEYTLGEENKTVSGNTAEVVLTANLTVTATIVAVESNLATLTFPGGNSKNTSSYTDKWEATLNGQKWSIANFNNNNNGWEYIRCGRKGNASVATIQTVLTGKVTEISLTIDSITADSVNSITLYVSNSSDYASSIIKEYTIDKSNGEHNVVIDKDIQAGGLCYTLVFDCKSARSNGIVQVSRVSYNGFAA